MPIDDGGGRGRLSVALATVFGVGVTPLRLGG